MKIKLRDSKKPEDRSKKFATIRTKYRRLRLVTIIISCSWIIREIIRYDKEIRQAVQSTFGI